MYCCSILPFFIIGSRLREPKSFNKFCHLLAHSTKQTDQNFLSALMTMVLQQFHFDIFLVLRQFGW